MSCATATTEIYTLSLHDALPISADAIVVDVHCEASSEKQGLGHFCDGRASLVVGTHTHVPTADHQILPGGTDRKSTRLNSSHGYISYAVFCLKKKIRLVARRQAT